MGGLDINQTAYCFYNSSIGHLFVPQHANEQQTSNLFDVTLLLGLCTMGECHVAEGSQGGQGSLRS